MAWYDTMNINYLPQSALLWIHKHNLEYGYKHLTLLACTHVLHRCAEV